jgi:hypothetical protein
MNAPGPGGILTLEPLIEAVRVGVEGAGWELSGLQKTTSHQFEGRWEGEATRSAYLFFHSDAVPEQVSIDVYLDETSRGLTGNLALVVDLVSLGELGDPGDALRSLGGISRSALPAEHLTPITLRLRLKDGASAPGDAEGEVRFKLRIPGSTIAGGHPEVERLATMAMRAFASILDSPELARYIAVE